MNKKDFDCVELQHQGALRIYEETKDLTRDQKIAYWKRKSDEAMKKYLQARNQDQGKKQ
jgi:hypothetical protein